MEAGSQGLRLTRMDLPYLLGSALTPHRGRASVYGLGLHTLNGWLVSLLYVALFHAAGLAAWWFGALCGAVHAAFVLMVLLPVLPALHPRMASADDGPDVVRQLEPPGFLGGNYGPGTAGTTLVAHLAFGAVLGWLYDV